MHEVHVKFLFRLILWTNKQITNIFFNIQILESFLKFDFLYSVQFMVFWIIFIKKECIIKTNSPCDIYIKYFPMLLYNHVL